MSIRPPRPTKGTRTASKTKGRRQEFSLDLEELRSALDMAGAGGSVFARPTGGRGMPVLHVEGVPAVPFDRIQWRAAAQQRDVTTEVIHLLRRALAEEARPD